MGLVPGSAQALTRAGDAASALRVSAWPKRAHPEAACAAVGGWVGGCAGGPGAVMIVSILFFKDCTHVVSELLDSPDIPCRYDSGYY